MAEIDIGRGKRVAGAATLATLVMAAGKGLVGFFSGSVALQADAVHTAADALAIFASWFGLSISRRLPDEKFPYGYYRAETIASLFASALIIFAGGSLLVESAGRFTTPPRIELPFLGMAVALASAVISLFIAVAERRAGRDLSSLSLKANADESTADILTSLLVFVALGASYLEIRFVEPALAAALSLLIIWIGLRNGKIGIYSLMDASLDPELEAEVAALMRGVEGVKDVEKVKIRRAGLFLMGEAHIKVPRSLDVERGHEVAHKAVDLVKKSIPRIEAFTVHLEPYQESRRMVMVPLREDRGEASRPSGHFGKAPYYAFSCVGEGAFSPPEIISNPFIDREARVGLAVAREFVPRKGVEVILTPEIGEIGFHTLRDLYVEIYRLEGSSLSGALEKFAEGKLEMIQAPTHSSDEKIGYETDEHVKKKSEGNGYEEKPEAR